jgi:hypothetical protein
MRKSADWEIEFPRGQERAQAEVPVSQSDPTGRGVVWEVW